VPALPPHLHARAQGAGVRPGRAPPGPEALRGRHQLPAHRPAPGVHHQSVINWVNAAAANLPAPPTPRERQGEAAVQTQELDELYTFISEKKSRPTS